MVAMILTLGLISTSGCSGGEADYSLEDVQGNQFTFLSSSYVYVEDNATEIIELQVRSQSDVEFEIIGGDDSPMFDVNATTGLITYATGIDGSLLYIENPDKVYEIVVQAVNEEGEEEKMVLRVQIVKDLTLVPLIIDSSINTNPSILPSLDEIITTVTAQSATNTPITYTLRGADSTFFVIDENGNLRFKTLPGFEPAKDADGNNVYEVTVVVKDAHQEAQVDISVTIAKDSDLVKPTIITAATIDYFENDTNTIQIEAASGTQSGINYALVSGSDIGAFTIDNVTGALSFAQTPDYEVPHDVNSDNVFEVKVSVTDQSTYANETTKLFAITVNGVNEGVTTSYTNPTVEGRYLDDLIENSQYTVIFTSTPIVSEDNVIYTIVNQEGDGTIFSISGDSLIIDTPSVPCTPIIFGCIKQTESFTVVIGRADEHANYTENPIKIYVSSE